MSSPEVVRVTSGLGVVPDGENDVVHRDRDVLLSQLVRADLLRSEAGRSAPALRAGIGAPHCEFYDAMARLLAKPSGPIALPEPCRPDATPRRIEAADPRRVS